MDTLKRKIIFALKMSQEPLTMDEIFGLAGHGSLVAMFIALHEMVMSGLLAESWSGDGRMMFMATDKGIDSLDAAIERESDAEPWGDSDTSAEMNRSIGGTR